MIIDANKLKEVLPYNVNCKFEKERFYLVPGHDDMAISDYCQLLYKAKTGEWRIQKHRFHTRKNEKHKIKIGVEGFIVRRKFYSVAGLVRKTFFADQDVYMIMMQSKLIKKRGKQKPEEKNIVSENLLKVTDCHVLKSKADLIEYVQAGCEGREPNYPKCQQGNVFINRNENTNYKHIHQVWLATKGRKTPVCDDWEKSFDKFGQWYLREDYPYTGSYGRLCLDSDLMGLGAVKMYSPETCCFIPEEINKVIWQLRKLNRPEQCFSRAEKLEAILQDERNRGEIPDKILDQIAKMQARYVEYGNELQQKGNGEQ